MNVDFYNEKFIFTFFVFVKNRKKKGEQKIVKKEDNSSKRLKSTTLNHLS
jgi:hypothetical protein